MVENASRNTNKHWKLTSGVVCDRNWQLSIPGQRDMVEMRGNCQISTIAETIFGFRNFLGHNKPQTVA